MSLLTTAGTVSVRGPLTRRRIAAWAVPLVFVTLGTVSLIALGVDSSLITEAAEGVGRFTARALPPRVSDPGTTVLHLLQTLAMALAGTTVAAALSLLLAVLAARSTSPSRSIRMVATGLIVTCRAIPDVVFAIFFVAAVGIGPLTGVLALGLHSVGMLGKLFIEAIERTDEGITEAVATTGAGPVQRLVSGVLPQIVPAVLAAVLFRLDINVRTAVLLGAVGAGGIGLDLKTAFGFTDYREAVGLSLTIVVVVIVVEALSALLRRMLIRAPKRHHAPDPRGGAVPWTAQRRIIHLTGWAGLVLAIAALWSSDLTPVSLVTSTIDSIQTLGRFFPPDFGAVSDVLVPGLLEVGAIAGVATVAGSTAGTLLGLAAAGNLAPTWLYLLARGLVSLLRCIPDLLLFLVCVAVVGLTEGALAGAVALSIHTASFVAKLVADAAEEVDRGPREALHAAGATRMQELVTTVLGQLTPSLVGTWLYALDINLRAFVLLSIVGAGDLGFLLSQTMRLRQYEMVTAIVLPVFVLVLLVELLSTRWRAALR